MTRPWEYRQTSTAHMSRVEVVDAEVREIQRINAELAMQRYWREYELAKGRRKR